MSAARSAGRARRQALRRDRRVYLASHPVLFALLVATRGRAVTRLGRTVLVQGTDAFREALTQVPLDRTAQHTTGGLAHELTDGGVLFDQDGSAHRQVRRSLADDLSAAGVQRLRPAWQSVLRRRLSALEAGGTVDMTAVAAELAGATVCALLELEVAPLAVARAASEVAAAAARQHLPGIRGDSGQAIADATRQLTALVGTGTAAMLAVAAVNTTVAGIPRSVAWCADAGLWSDAATDGRLDALNWELLRVTAATGLLPRVAAEAGTVAGRPVRKADRLVMVARHAAHAHSRMPDACNPAPQSVAQLVFGAGPHACPGAAMARAQLADTLRMLAPYRPVVVRAIPDRRSALPGWKSLVIRAGPARDPGPVTSSRTDAQAAECASPA